MTTRMSEREIAAALAQADGWAETGGQIQRTYQFDDFLGAMAFVNRIADYAERAQHHPDILIRYSKVTLSVNTHDAGGITAKDFALAEEADRLANG